MTEENDFKGNFFFEDIVKRTKTGITFPKDLRDSLFKEDKDIYFRIIVPNEKDRIILEILNEDEIESISEKLKVKKATVIAKKSSEKITKFEKKGKLNPNW